MRTKNFGVGTFRKSSWSEKSEIGVLAPLWPDSDPLKDENCEEDELCISMMENGGENGVYIDQKVQQKRRTKQKKRTRNVSVPITHATRQRTTPDPVTPDHRNLKQQDADIV